MNQREKEIVAHHESGHALFAEILPTTDRVHKVSMIPRGLGALGYTMQLPLEDRYLMTRPELLDKITVLMGGRAAEKRRVQRGVDGRDRRSAARDRSGAAHGRRSSACRRRSGRSRWSTSAAARSSASCRSPQLVGERGYSERTQQLIDQEVGELLRRSFDRAVALLEHNRAQLLALAARLREKEVIEGDELRAALEGAEAPPALQGPDELQWAQLAISVQANRTTGWTGVGTSPTHARAQYVDFRRCCAEARARSSRTAADVHAASRRGRSPRCS